jgi:asparagine synthetase B (glutamine-hydrolysing)
MVSSGSIVALSFKNKSFRIDESFRAKIFSFLLGVTHVSVSSNEKNLQNLMEKLSQEIDSPIADPSSLAYSLLFQKTHELGIKVAITGHGVDELFWGYDWYNRRIAALRMSEASTQKIFWNTPAASPELSKLIEPYEPLNRFGSRDPYLIHHDKWRRARAEIVHSYLNCNGFAQLDRLGMRQSIEPRVPFSDSRLYFWCQINGKNGKESADKGEFLDTVNVNRFRWLKLKYSKKGFRTQFLEALIDSNEKKIVEESSRVFKLRGLNLQNPLNHEVLNPTDLYKLFVLTNFLKGFKNESYV